MCKHNPKNCHADTEYPQYTTNNSNKTTSKLTLLTLIIRFNFINTHNVNSRFYKDHFIFYYFYLGISACYLSGKCHRRLGSGQMIQCQVGGSALKIILVFVKDSVIHKLDTIHTHVLGDIQTTVTMTNTFLHKEIHVCKAANINRFINYNISVCMFLFESTRVWL